MHACMHAHIHTYIHTYIHAFIPGGITLCVTGAALPALVDTPEEVGLGTNAAN